MRKDFWFLFSSSILLFFLRLPSLFEPYWYGDEGIYQVIGKAILNGRVLYSEIWDNKPPLLYLLYGALGSDQFTIRLVSLITGVVSTIVFFHLTKYLSTNIRIRYASTLLFVILFATPFLEGNIANSENFMMLPTLTAGFLSFGYLKTRKRNTLYLIGFLLSLSFLFKAVAVFDLAAFSLFLFIALFHEREKLFKRIKNLLPVAIGFFAPVVFFALYFLIAGAFKDFLNASFGQNIGYVGYGNQFLFPQGLLVLKLIILTFVTLFLFIKRKHIAPPLLFISLWFSFSLFNAYLSQRPYTHYLLVLLPAMILFAGLLVSFNKRFNKTHIVLIGLFVLITFLVYANFHLYTKTFAYYGNFLSYITGNKSTQHYYAFFDRNTPKDYDIARFLKLNLEKNDAIFIWGNNGQLYKLVDRLPPGRYIVAYHITGFKNALYETESELTKAKPKYIIQTSVDNPYPFSLSGYLPRLRIQKSIVYERTN